MACAIQYDMRYMALCNECVARDDYENVLYCLPILFSFMFRVLSLVHAGARRCPQVPAGAHMGFSKCRRICLCLRSCCAFLTRNHTRIEGKLPLPLASVCASATCGVCPSRDMGITGLQTPSRHCPLHSTLSKVFSCKRLSPRMPQRSCRIRAIDERQLLGEVGSRLLGQTTDTAGGTPESWSCSTHSLRCNDWKEVAAHLQDFGARDPTAGEVASNFTDRVLGNADTSHIIRQGCLFVIFECFFSAGWLLRCFPVQGPQRPGEAGRPGSQKVYTLRRGKHAAHG